MRSTARIRQRGFSLIEVMTASIILSIFILGVGAFWLTADRRANDLVLRQKAIFIANGEMERLTALYGNTSFGAAGPAATTGYDGVATFPATRLTYPTSVSLYTGGADDYVTTSTNTFSTGPGTPFRIWVNSQLVPTLNRAYVWLDQGQNVMGRLSWTTTNITPASCVVGSDGCGCLNYLGLLSGPCQKLEMYLEYPYRLVSGAPVAGTHIRSVTLSTIVGRHT
jgi:prepilin-type N-terminal cleavage/methylation domain-containing protein